MDTLSIFFALLRSGMTGESVPEAELPDHINWEGVVALARKHTVLGIVIAAVQTLPAHLRPDVALTTKMNKFALGLLKTNIVLDRTVAKLVSFLHNHGVNGVLLKGQGIARVYRDPYIRQVGDIDYYVGSKQYSRAVALCKEHLMVKGEKGDENTQHFDFTLDRVTVELHRIATIAYSPFIKGKFRRWLEYQLEEADDRRTLNIAGADVTLPSLDFDVIYIFYHAWRHYLTGGIGLRQLCDWAMLFLTHGADIDRDRIIADLKRFHMTKGWCLFACIAVRYLGVSAASIPLYDPRYEKQSRRVFQEIMTGGNFGTYFEDTPIFYSHEGGGIREELGKIPSLTRYCASLFPLIPAEATFLYFHRLTAGLVAFAKKKTGRHDAR